MTAPSDDTDHERLIEATLAGDDEAFAGLVRQTKGRVFGIAARFARNDHELDDICQDVFIRVYQNLSRFRRDAPFVHWISKIAIRTCYDYLRKRQRDREQTPFDEQILLEDLSSGRELAAGEAAEILRFALAHVSPDERLVITMLELEENSVKEIAELTGWSEANVKVRAFRARAALKRVLKLYHEQVA